MIVKGRQQSSFLKSPLPDGIDVVLLYGPNAGRINEIADDLKGQLSDAEDPFSYVPLTMEDINQDPARLTDEFASGSLMGSDRLIHVRDGDKGLTSILKIALEAVQSPQNKILIEAGGLSPKDTLRKLGESNDRVAILPFYEDDKRTLSQYVRESLSEEMKTIDSDATEMLIDAIGMERALIRQSIEKIVTYVGDKRAVQIEDVRACVVQESRQTLDELVEAVMTSNYSDLERCLAMLWSENTSTVYILRSMQRHFKRLRQAHAYAQSGYSVDQAMKSLRPPVFFKLKDQFQRDLRLWSIERIDTVLSQLVETERLCKTTGTADQLITHRQLAQIG